MLRPPAVMHAGSHSPLLTSHHQNHIMMSKSPIQDGVSGEESMGLDVGNVHLRYALAQSGNTARPIRTQSFKGSPMVCTAWTIYWSYTFDTWRVVYSGWWRNRCSTENKSTFVLTYLVYYGNLCKECVLMGVLTYDTMCARMHEHASLVNPNI